jgi:hypothetical protein
MANGLIVRRTPELFIRAGWRNPPGQKIGTGLIMRSVFGLQEKAVGQEARNATAARKA